MNEDNQLATDAQASSAGESESPEREAPGLPAAGHHAAANLIGVISWAELSMGCLNIDMMMQGRKYWGTFIADGERHVLETCDRYGKRGKTWYMIQLELGPAGFFGWTDEHGEVVVRWRAGKHARKVPVKQIAGALKRYHDARSHFVACRGHWADRDVVEATWRVGVAAGGARSAGLAYHDDLEVVGKMERLRQWPRPLFS